MAINVYVETEIARTNQHSVNYLVEDDATGEVRFFPALLTGDDIGDAAGYGAENAAALYAAGAVAADGQVRIEKLLDKDTDDLRQEALQVVRRGIRRGDALGDILDDVVAVYAGQTGILNFLTGAVVTYNAGTAAEQRQFNILMFYLLFAG